MQSLRRILAVVAALLSAGVCAQATSPSHHVWLITEENISFMATDPGATGAAGYRRYVYRNTIDAPFFNRLITAPPAGMGSTVVTNLFSDTHSSFPVWMYFASGSVPASTNNEQCLNQPNLVRSLLGQNMTWRAYSEGMPTAGFQGDNTTVSTCTDTTLFGNRCGYKRGHNPLINFTDTSASAANGGLPGGSCPESGQENNSLPMSQFTPDVAQGSVADFVYITPDLGDDTHGSCSGCSFSVGHGLGHGDGSLKAADSWLAQVVPLILARPEFQPGGDGVLLVLWDEGNIRGGGNPPSTATDAQCGGASDPNNCGGHIGLLALGPQVQSSVVSGNLAPYHLADVLRTVCSALALTSCPGAGATAKTIPLFASIPPAAPTAVLNLTPSSGSVPLLVTADASASHNAVGAPVTRSSIQFGDGATAAGPRASHQYAAPGTFTVTVTVWDQNGVSATASSQVVVNSAQLQPPAAVLTVTPTSGRAPVTVSASTARSSDPGGTIVSSIVNFGDGTVASGTSLSHTYSVPGTFTITGTVRDNRGLAAAATARVTVSAPVQQQGGPVAQLQVSPADGVAPLNVSASTAGSKDPNGGALASSIDFGDGTVVHAPAASHQYTRPGVYTVTASERNASGQIAVATRQVHISSSKADFALSAMPENIAVSGRTYRLVIRPLDSLYSPVRLTCRNLPPGMSCSFLPPIVTPGQNPAFSELRLVTGSSVATLTPLSFPGIAMWLPLVGLAVVAGRGGARRRNLRDAVLLGAVLLAIALAPGCGGGNMGPVASSAAQQNAITVVASTGTRSHSITLAVGQGAPSHKRR